MSAPRLARKKLLGFALGAVAYPALVRADDVFTLRLSISPPPGSTYYLHATEFANTVNRRANGRLKIEVYPSGQLAKQYESIAGLITGTVDFSLHDAAYLSSVFAPAEAVLLPFMFKNIATLYRVVDGPVGDQLFKQLDGKGILGLSWGAGGFRAMETTNKPIVKVEDMKGLRIRIHGGTDVAMMQALGAIPLSIDSTETFTALSQHTIDGEEVGIENLVSDKTYPFLKHIAISNHVPSIAPLLASKKKIEALPADLQAIVRDSAVAVRSSWRTLYAQRAQEAVDFVKQNGASFTEIDWAAFRRLMTPIYASVEPKVGADILQQVTKAAGS